jgi:tRNA(fMet)-specific endonuclease VapC
MPAYLIDTNHASRLMDGIEPIVSRVRNCIAHGDAFFLSITVVGELYYAVYASQRVRNNLRRFEALRVLASTLPFGEAEAREYGRIQAELKARGRPIPGTDAQIAAVARLHGLTVLTADRHFRFVDRLTTANWLEVGDSNVGVTGTTAG